MVSGQQSQAFLQPAPRSPRSSTADQCNLPSTGKGHAGDSLRHRGAGNRERAAPFYAACNCRYQGKVITIKKVDPAFSEASLLPLWFAKN